MTLFVDASAIIAILAGEPDREQLVARLVGEELLWSPLSQWEAIVGLAKAVRVDLDEALRRVFAFGEDWRIRMVAIGENEGGIALQAHSLYGKGNHPAALNFGDCFAYACASANNARLLYKGNDFSQTRLA